MSSNSTKIKNSAVIVPVASPTLSDQGELAYDSVDDKLKIRNLASTDNVLQEANIATITNKVIDAADNTISGIADANIDAAAAIDASKLADGSVSNTEFQYLDGVTSNIQDQLDGALTDALPNGNILIGNASNVAVAHPVSGDISLSNTGVTDISAGAIVNADVNASAAIAGSKISPDFGAQNIVTTGAADVGNIHIATNTISSTNANGNINLDPLGTGQVRLESELRLPEISTPATPTSGYGLLYFKSDNFLYQKNDVGTESKVGAGSGGINYIANGDASNDTADWQFYNDGPVSRPVTGSGAGSINLTLVASAVSPLRGANSFVLSKDAANRQGQGIMYNYTIDNADKSKVLSISFDYEIASGTYSGGTSLTDSDLIVYMYRTTATGHLIEPSVIKLDGSVIGTKYSYRGIIQADSDATGYRFILHVATTSASAYDFKFDNLVIGPQQPAYGSIITDWVDYTPTGSWVANTTYTGKWRRVGSVGEFDINIRNSGAPTGVLATVNLPSGMLIDTTKLAAGGDSENFTLGIVSIFDSGGIEYAGRVEYVSQTGVEPRVSRADSTYVDPGTAISATVPFTFGSADEIYIRFAAPIVGWGATATIGQDADTRVTAMCASGNAPSATAGNPIIFPTNNYDTHGGYSVSTGKYTIPTAGLYQIHGFIESATAGAVVSVYVDNVNTRTLGVTDASGDCSYTGTIKVNSGQLVHISTDTTIDITVLSTLCIDRLSGPSQIAASETVAMAVSAAIPTGGTDGTSTTIMGDTPFYDTHGGYNPVTGIYRIPAAGKYFINGVIILSGSSSSPQRSLVQLFKNGSTFVNGLITRHTSTLSTDWTVSVSTTRAFNAGDTLELRVNTNITSPVFTNGNVFGNLFEITRVGN